MLQDFFPIIAETPKDFSQIEVYIVGDLHVGSAIFDERKWMLVKNQILAEPNRYVMFSGDLMENAVPGSKSDVFSQTMTPHEQREYITNTFKELKDRILCVVDGNHERNRSTVNCGLYPLYDACCIAGIEDRYRPNMAIVDIGVGSRDGGVKQVQYACLVTHQMKVLKQFAAADAWDGIDVAIFAHTHNPEDLPKAKLVYDSKNKTVSVKPVELINGGSFLRYENSYGSAKGYRIQSQKMYKLILSGRRTRDGAKSIMTVGYYV